MFRQVGFSSLIQATVKSRWRQSISVSASSRTFTKVPFRFASINARPVIQFLSASQSRDCLLVNWKSNEGGQEKSYEGKFDNFWLRDNCRCSQCYTTNQRLFDTASLPTDIQPKQVTLSDKTSLEIKWQDGHKSNYTADWLLENAYDCSSEFITKQEPDPVKEPIAWGREISDDPPRVGYNGVMTDDKSLLEVSDKIDVYGFCLVDDAPLEPAGTEDLVRRFGVIKNSHYGMVWIIEPNNHVVS